MATSSSVNRLGVIVAVISALAVLLVFGIIIGVRALFSNREVAVTPTPLPVTVAGQQVTSPDSDNDGLTDDVESIYRTDPNNPDTDTDGTNDGDELLQLRDPITAGPNDTLADINEAGDIDTSTYTGRYLATLPKDASQAEVLSSDRLQTFINKERGATAIEAFTPTIKTTTDSDAEAVETYLNEISASHNTEIAAVTSDDITNAFTVYLQQRDSQDLDDIAEKLDSNLKLLRAVPAPAEAADLHKTLLAASQALLENVKLLQGITDDFIGGLVGAKNIEELGTTFQGIADQVSDLETTYNLQ